MVGDLFGGKSLSYHRELLKPRSESSDAGLSPAHLRI
jgi:hypothetical protein